MIERVRIKSLSVIFLGAMLALSCYRFAVANDQAIPWDNNLQYPAPHSGVDMSALNNYHIDNNGTVFIKDGHFWTKQGRINFFGVDLTFSTCFPEKEQAEQLASQLAGLGVNIVRLHHMDMRQIWGDNIATYADFDAGQMDKLDYLVFCLKNKGIYVDLNLHVSWQYISDKNSPLYNLIHTEKAFEYGKGLDIFLPELIAKQKEYAARLLTHRNSYTGLAYKDDPVVAMVEINNENSFYRNMVSEKGIDLLPPAYRDVLNEKFRNFLQDKYGSLANLKRAWRDNSVEPAEINGHISLPRLDKLPTYPAQRRDDVTAFFRQTEWQYWSDMIHYVKQDLGVRAPITGTQIDYSTPELAALYDYVDIHSYWQHLTFPGKVWNSDDYYLKNVSMVSEAGSNFDKVASFRVRGKPFTISEYNHLYPNMYNTEAPLMLSVLSKLQDYDAVFLFDYGNISHLELPSYFSQDTKFADKSLYPVSSLIFRDSAIQPLPEEVVWPVAKGDLFRRMRDGRRYINPYFGEWDKQQPPGLFTLYQTKRISLQLMDQGNYEYKKTRFSDDAAVNPNFTWKRGTPDYRDAFFKYDEAKAKVYIGWNTQEHYDFTNVGLRISHAPKQYFQFTIMNKDGAIGDTGRYMVTLAGREFYDHVDYIDHDTKAKLNPFDENYRANIMAVPNAAQATERIENFTAMLSVKLGKPYRSIAVYTIDAVGNRSKDIPFQVVGDELRIPLRQADQSIVYCIAIT